MNLKPIRGEEARDWRTDPVTLQFRDRLRASRKELVARLIGASRGSTDPTVRGLAGELEALVAIAKLLEGEEGNGEHEIRDA